MQYIASVTKSTAQINEEASTSHQPPDPSKVSEQASTSSLHDQFLNFHPHTMQVESQSIQVNLPYKGVDFGCQVNTRGAQLMMQSADTQTPLVCSSHTGTQFEESDIPEEKGTIAEEAVGTLSPEVSPQKEGTYLPSTSGEMSDDSNLESDHEDEKPKVLNPQDDTKFIVFKQELFKLFKRCPECGAPVIQTDQSTQGTQLFVTLICSNNHTFSWQSQPMLERMAAGNLLLSSSILLSGSTYTRVASLADILNLKFLSENTFYTIQKKYLFPVINECWKREQNSIFSGLAGQDLWLSGDGRCDSPGHNAKYGTYTMIDQRTDKIVDFQIVQVTEVNNSNAMEREGFKRCMDNIKTKGGNIKVIATDRHVGIRADLKRNYSEVDHQFDVWHLSKSITKKLMEKAKKKDCSDLSAWIKSISNHLWWCAETCEGDNDLLREKWLSIVHHTANIHSWNSADLYHQCAHPPIPRNVARTKRWLRPGSPAHEALKEVVFDKTLVKDIQQLTLCCHTGSLEVYHSVQTKYVPKRQHFSYEGMVARTQLSALDHNANTGRQHATASKGANQGELQYKVVFPKHTKEWVAKPILEKTNRDHLRPMLNAIIARKNQKPHERSAPPAAPHIPQNIASKPRPAKDEVIAKHTSRFGNT